MTSQASVDALPVNVSNTVARVVEDYLDDLESTAPGLVAGVYLTGSVALGDFHPAWSDIDFVTILKDPPDDQQRMLIADIHERAATRHQRPRLDGYYLTWDDLSTPPDRGTTLGLRALGGVLQHGINWTPSILTWHELADHGLHVYGPGLDLADIARDDEMVRTWCLDAIERQWTPWWYRNANLWSGAGLGSLGTWSPASGVLGVTRVHYMLTTGRVTSKCGAGEWALSVCEPEWRRLLEECLRIRNKPTKRSLYRDPFTRRRDALAFMDLLMTADEETFGVDLSGQHR
ncbi:MAG: DUF4111 domain-containing protein [Actinomycetota bacterium]|nr:DUF4111 domain-containing protein [Actinomycetota bacterium]